MPPARVWAVCQNPSKKRNPALKIWTVSPARSTACATAYKRPPAKLTTPAGRLKGLIRRSGKVHSLQTSKKHIWQRWPQSWSALTLHARRKCSSCAPPHRRCAATAFRWSVAIAPFRAPYVEPNSTTRRLSGSGGSLPLSRRHARATTDCRKQRVNSVGVERWPLPAPQLPDMQGLAFFPRPWVLMNVSRSGSYSP